MSFFSYQPNQGLSGFRTKPLQRTGGGSREFIDPTLEASEGIDDLSMGDNTLDPRTLAEGSGGGMMNTTTGTQFGVSDQLRSMLDQQEQNPQAAQQAAQGPAGPDDTERNINAVTGAVSKVSKQAGLFDTKAAPQDAEGLDLQAPETDWTSPESVGNYLQNNPQSKLSLYASEFNQTPEDVSSMIGQGGGAPFDLGSTQLNADFLDQYDRQQPSTTTGARTSDVGGAFQGGVSAVTGATVLGRGIQSGDPLQIAAGVLQTSGGVFKLVQSAPDIAKVLGLDPKFVDTISASSAGAGAILGLYSGISALKEGNMEQGLPATLGGLVSGYNAIQQLTKTNPEIIGELPSLGDAAFKAINAISPGAADALKSAFASAPAASGSVAGNLSVAGGIGAAVAAVLGIIAQQTGSKELAQAAQALGGAVSAIGIAASAASAIAGSTAAAAAGASAGAIAAGAGVGLAAGAGVAFAPVAAMLLVFSIGNMIDPDNFPDLIGEAIGTDPYQTFNEELFQNVGQQGIGFQTLRAALPYVKTKEELGQLINSMKNYVSTTTGIALEDRSGTGDPYRLSAIPGVGPRTHGQATTPVDWARDENALQSMIDSYLQVLPGERITAAYGQPGGGLEGEAGRRLWSQFRQEGTGFATGGPTFLKQIYGTVDEGGQQGPTGQETLQSLPIYAGEGQPYGWYGGEPDFGNQSEVAWQQPVWDPETGNFVYTSSGGMKPKAPSEYFQKSPYWTELTTGVNPEREAQLAAEQQQQSAGGLSQFNPENQEPVDARGIPDDGNPDHPYELDQSGRPVHPEVWGIPGMRLGGAYA